jgi:hypothetical protein
MALEASRSGHRQPDEVNGGWYRQQAYGSGPALAHPTHNACCGDDGNGDTGPGERYRRQSDGGDFPGRGEMVVVDEVQHDKS